MERKLIKFIREYYENENTSEFMFKVKHFFSEHSFDFFYYVENKEMHEILHNDKRLCDTFENNKDKENKIITHSERECVYCYYANGTNIAFRVSSSTQYIKTEMEEKLRVVAYVIEKSYELKYYRINSFISPFFYEISKIFYPIGDINVALENFVQIFDDIFGVRITRIENSKRVFFYRETHNEKVIESEHKNLRVKYMLVRKIDNSIELEKVFKVAFFILETFLEAKSLEEKQKEFLEYQILSKDNLSKLNRLLEKSLYKMTFISSLYKKLSLVREIKEALEIVQKCLKNEVGYDYLKIECGEVKVEDGVCHEKDNISIFENSLMEDSVVFRISLYKTEVSTEDNVYIGLIFNNSKVEIENILLYKRVEQMAIIDGVTQLYIHRYFVDALDKAISLSCRYNSETALIMCDIDNFKQYNDTHGHLEGDRALCRTATVIRESIRNVDIPCRYGGEEFIIILPHTSIENAEKLAERIRRNIEKNAMVTVSVGVVGYIKGEERDNFIKRADQAMYSAKKSGKNKVVVE